MEAVIWILIVALFILSFVGLLFPIVPSVLVLWAGFILYIFFIDGAALSVWFWIGAGVLTVLLFAADLIASQFFVKKYGGSKWSERMAAVGVIVGSFIMPPFGIILVPFALVFIAEFIATKDARQAVLVAIASFFAFLSGTVAKALVQAVLIIWFFIEVFI
ncbi:hypothetical protein BTR22_03760 [Alkalihalophilus pseudofirmus]|uniref:DUF456 family protein n=1 Tax=Alkalihalophilus pseudofirmus TaxID=79885 RepID=A0AAJ2U3J7_ALKPS|nr:DUF456 family protein [Alkalihalophilus pseudofirmus]MDV2886515.1 DUF456 family protein [Alkalihalophilus pseudofirmus]OLS38778.1 hypothetical protein BTR22_03760 [Alkalihalophilus pseudofirmus]